MFELKNKSLSVITQLKLILKFSVYGSFEINELKINLSGIVWTVKYLFHLT